MIDLKTTKKIILFDGVCNLCNSSVLKVIRFDTKNRFIFTSLQSKTGQKIIKHLNINTSLTDSIILYEPNVGYEIKSSAILKIMNELGGFWKFFQIFWLIPNPIRDIIYDYIAKNRYKWFGKKEQCLIPTPELTTKFLD